MKQTKNIQYKISYIIEAVNDICSPSEFSRSVTSRLGGSNSLSTSSIKSPCSSSLSRIPSTLVLFAGSVSATWSRLSSEKVVFPVLVSVSTSSRLWKQEYSRVLMSPLVAAARVSRRERYHQHQYRGQRSQSAGAPGYRHRTPSYHHQQYYYGKTADM